MSRDIKNKCRLLLIQAIDGVYIAIEDTVQSQHKVRNKFRETEIAYREYQEACGRYAVHLETWGHVEVLAKLQVECSRTEVRYQECIDAKDEALEQWTKSLMSKEKEHLSSTMRRLFINTTQVMDDPVITTQCRDTRPKVVSESVTQPAQIAPDSPSRSYIMDENCDLEVEQDGAHSVSAVEMRQKVENWQTECAQVLDRDPRFTSTPNKNRIKHPEELVYDRARISTIAHWGDREQTMQQWEEDTLSQGSLLSNASSYTEYRQFKKQEQPIRVNYSQMQEQEDIPVQKQDLCKQKKEYYTYHPESSQQIDRYLTKVKLPTFQGNKKEFEAWWATFLECVDRSDAPVSAKLLRLREVLEGDALKVLEGLTHCTASYITAMQHLERKYGGERRLMTLRYGDLHKQKMVREGSARELERFGELVESIIISSTQAGRHGELGVGALYMLVQQKLSQNMLTAYYKWLRDNQKIESVWAIRDYIIEEAANMTKASETLHGVEEERNRRPPGGKVLHSTPLVGGLKTKAKKPLECRVCGQEHPLWKCPAFEKLSVHERWEIAKKGYVCFNCLSGGHRGEDCPRARPCGLQGCRRRHHRLLHDNVPKGGALQEPDKNEKQTEQTEKKMPQIGKKSVENDKEKLPIHGAVQTSYAMGGIDSVISLRTVAVELQNGDRKVKVTALLDDGSSFTLLNQQVADQLGLQGQVADMEVGVLGGKRAQILGEMVEMEIKGIGMQEGYSLQALTTNQVTGELKPFDWTPMKRQWEHLQDISFPKAIGRAHVDLLIGSNAPVLHTSLQERVGQIDEPVARLTPLGWTCIGPVKHSESSREMCSYFVSTSQQLDDLVRKFWSIEEYQDVAVLKCDEKKALDIVSDTCEHVGDRYQVGIPWKSCRETLPNNRRVAEQRLKATEKRLMKKPDLAQAYGDIFKQYLEKKYIRRVAPHEDVPPEMWYLPHFPVVRNDKTTTKIRVVFNASAEYEGYSLNA